MEAIAEDVSEGFQVDNQAKLDYHCSAFDWVNAIRDIDYSLIKTIRRFSLTLSNSKAILSGLVANDAEVNRLNQHFRAALPRSVAFESQVASASQPEASLSV